MEPPLVTPRIAVVHRGECARAELGIPRQFRTRQRGLQRRRLSSASICPTGTTYLRPANQPRESIT